MVQKCGEQRYRTRHESTVSLQLPFFHISWSLTDHVCLRRELAKQTQSWHNQVVDTDREQVSVEDGFLWQLKGFTDKDVQDHRSAISSAQERLIGDGSPFEYRQQYTSILENQLPPKTRETHQSHEEELMLELEELAEDLDIYVEREGLEHTSNVEQRQNTDNPELETGDGG